MASEKRKGVHVLTIAVCSDGWVRLLVADPADQDKEAHRCLAAIHRNITDDMPEVLEQFKILAQTVVQAMLKKAGLDATADNFTFTEAPEITEIKIASGTPSAGSKKKKK